jgi:hypothetical protein
MYPVIGETITSAVLKISLWKYICRFLIRRVFSERFNIRFLSTYSLNESFFFVRGTHRSRCELR